MTRSSRAESMPNSRSDDERSFHGVAGPLNGKRVLDFSHVIAGPYCAMMLADMGADVVKVERRNGGDDLRSVGRYPGRRPVDEDYFNALNRRKRSIALDLRSPEDQAVVQELARQADVVLQNFAPGTAERLSIGPKELRATNPKLVYCAISGFGQTGILRNRLALDPIIQSMSGVMSVTGEPNGQPMQIGAPIADVVAGMFGAYAIVSALMQVERGGDGAFIDISMLESMIAVLGPRMGEALQAKHQPPRHGNENPMRVPAGIFECADGHAVNFIVQNQNYWKPFCRALEREEWLEDPRFQTMVDRVRNREAINELVRARLKDEPAAVWIDRLLAQKVPCGPYYDYLEALNDPHVRNRGLILRVHHPVSGDIELVGPPWVSNLKTPPLTPPPLLGEHEEAILADWLGRTNASSKGIGVGETK